MTAVMDVNTVSKQILATLSQDPQLLNLTNFIPVLTQIMTEVANFEQLSDTDKKQVVTQVMVALTKRLPFPESSIMPPIVQNLVPGAIDMLIAAEQNLVSFKPGQFFHWPTQTTKPVPPKTSDTTGRKYCLKAPQPDTRDLVMVPKTTKPPSSVDLRPHMPPVLDQLSLGACGSHATSNCLRYLLGKEGQKVYQPSRLMIYYQTRVNIEGESASDDTGVQIRDLCKALKAYGAADEKYWPYDVDKFAGPPPKAALTNEKLHRQIQFHSVPQDLASMKATLADGLPIIIGIAVYDSFESDAVAANGKVPMPDTASETCLGGHALLIVGYDDTTSCFVVQNSWGATADELAKGGVTWGDRGYCYIPYSYLTDPNLASDFWAISFFD